MTEGRPLVIALPLVSTAPFEGLATALKRLLTQAGVNTFFIFVRGSQKRFEALKNQRCDIAVMSVFSASHLCDSEAVCALELPPGSYTSEHRVFYVSETPSRHRVKVLIDPDSVDQSKLSELEFAGASVEYVRTSYVRFGRALEEGTADAAIWTTEEMAQHRPQKILSRPLSDRVRRRIGDGDTRVAFVVRAADASVQAVVSNFIQPGGILAIQEAVIAGEMVPEY